LLYYNLHKSDLFSVIPIEVNANGVYCNSGYNTAFLDGFPFALAVVLLVLISVLMA
jgi:hypothetical protein